MFTKNHSILRVLEYHGLYTGPFGHSGNNMIAKMFHPGRPYVCSTTVRDVSALKIFKCSQMSATRGGTLSVQFDRI